MAVVARSKAKRFDAMDFVPTISDSESDVPDLRMPLMRKMKIKAMVMVIHL